MKNQRISINDSIRGERDKLIKRIKESFAKDYEQKIKNEEFQQKVWEQFEATAKKNKFFNLQHVFDLKVDFNILMVLGKKNIGKTRNIYRLFEDAIHTGSKVIFMRASKTELDNFCPEFNADPKNPLVMHHTRAGYMLYNRETGVNCGRCVDFKSCQSIGGGEFADYKYIIFDECITYDPRQSINKNHMGNWAAFTSSVARNKKGLKVFMFGNLINMNSMILDFYGVERDAKCCYFERGSAEDKCKILYLNTGNLYAGISQQGGISHHASPEFFEQLDKNEIIVVGDNIVCPKYYREMQVAYNFIHEMKIKSVPTKMLITVKKTPTDPYSHNQYVNYAVKVSIYDMLHEIEGRIFTDDKFIKNASLNTIWLPNLNNQISLLSRVNHKGRLYFTDADRSEPIVKLLIEKYEKDRVIIR